MKERPTNPFARMHHLSVVVEDLQAAQRFYESIGIGPFQDYPPLGEYVDIQVPDVEGFYELKIKWARIGPVQLQLIQPGQGESLYKEFLEKNGPGVFHLGFAVDDLSRAQDRVGELGLKVISRGRRENGSGFAYLDTAAQAGVTLLIRQSPPE